MADKTNNITTVFSADISNFSKSTQELNRYISTVNSEFKNATAGMGDWSKSADGLEAKLKQLNGVLSAQKKQLETTETAYKKLKDEGKENTAEAQKLYIKLQQQQAQVKQTEAAINKYSDSLKNLDKEQENTEKSTGKLSSGFASLAKGAVAGLTAAVAGTVTAFFALAESTRELRTEMGKLETAYTTAGLSAEAAESTYTDLYSVLGDTGKATEAAQQLAQIAKSEEELAGLTHTLTGIYATWGDSLPVEALSEAINASSEIGSVQGNLADALEWSGVNLDDFNASLATMTTEEERSAYITSTLNDLYGEAADTYKEVNADVIAANEAQANLNSVLADLGAIAEPIMTMLKTLAVELLQSITPFVALIGEGLTGAFNGAEGAAESLAEGLGGILKVIVEKITTLLPTVLNIILQLIPSIANTLLSQIPILLNTVVSLVTQILNLLSQLIPDILAKIVEILPQIIESITSAAPVLLQAATDLLLSLVQAVGIILPKLISELPRIISSIVTGLLGAIPDLIACGAQLLGGLIKGMLNPKAIWEAVKQIGKSILDGFLSFFGIHSPSKVMADEIGTNLALGIGEGFENDIDGVKKSMVKSMDGLSSELNTELNVSGYANSTAGQAISTGGSSSSVNNSTVNVYQTFTGLQSSRYALRQARLETLNAVKLAGGV